MAIKTVRAYVIQCDRCKKYYNYNNEYEIEKNNAKLYSSYEVRRAKQNVSYPYLRQAIFGKIQCFDCKEK